MSWPLVQLDTIAEINPRLPKDTVQSQKVTFLPMAAVSEQGKVIAGEERILSETKKGFTYFERGDVILAKITPCFENGKAALLSELNTQIGFGSTEFHVIRANTAALLPEYIFYILWNEQFRYFGERNMTGSAGQKRVPANFLKSLQIPLPPLPIQKQIAAALEKVDTLRKQCQQMEQELNTLAQSVFLDMFGDPVGNPKRFPSKALGSLAAIQIGPFGTMLHKSDYISDGIPLINPTHIVKSRIKPNYNLTITKAKFAELPQYHLEEGDIIMGRRGEMGRCAIVTAIEIGYFCGTGSLFLRPDKKALRARYLNDLLSSVSIKRWFSEQSLGATMPNLNKGIVSNLSLPLPTLDEQLRYEEVLNNIASRLDNYKRLDKEFEDNFNALMQRAFKGELNLKDVD